MKDRDKPSESLSQPEDRGPKSHKCSDEHYKMCPVHKDLERAHKIAYINLNKPQEVVMGLTDEQKKAYPKEPACPYCGHDEIQGFGPSRQGCTNESRAFCRCLSCDSEWEEIWTLMGIEEVKICVLSLE